MRNNLEVLSNWLARLTVNQVSQQRVGSNPTTSTSTVATPPKISGGETPKPNCLVGFSLPGERCSSRGVEESGLSRLTWTEEHAGSNPAPPTT